MEPHNDIEITLSDLLAIVRRRRRIIYSTVLLFLVAAVFYCVTATRRYEAIGVIEMQKEAGDAFGLSNMLSGSTDTGDSSMGANIDLQTKANILQSDTLALKTIEGLNLEYAPDFMAHKTVLGAILNALLPKHQDGEEKGPLEDSPKRRHSAIAIFENNLTVKPVGGTRLIEIHYESPDPKLAAAVVNTLTRALIDYTFQTRFQATNQTSQWLREQLGDLRKDSEDLQARVVDLERQSGVYGLDTTDAQGQQQSYSDVVSRLQLATTAMTIAEQNRILKGAIARAAESGDPELISGLAGNSMAGTAMASSLALVETLRAQETAAQASLDQSSAKYGPAYSRISELKGQLAGIQRSIKVEIGRVKARAESDAQIANETAAGARSQYRAIKAEADKLNDKAIEYAIAKQDAVESRSLYEDLVKRLKEAGVLESLKSSNLTVVDPGRNPAVPKKPNVPLTILLALVGGFVIGCSAAFLYHSLDRTVHTIADLEAATGVGVMAALPLVDLPTLEKGRVILQSLPQSPFSEAIRTARTAILLSKKDRPPKTILVTSSLPREGKSLFSVNLAAALARQGKRVLVVDIDLRRGTLSRRFNLSVEGGLSTVLSGISTALAIHKSAELGGLSIIGPGPVPPDPSELLGSDTFLRYLTKWREEYDFVVLDSAPVLPVTDSVSVSRLVDTTILLARAGLVRREQVRRCYSLLAHGDAHNLGIILNGMSNSDASYYDYYGYYGRSGDVYPLPGEELCTEYV